MTWRAWCLVILAAPAVALVALFLWALIRGEDAP